MTAPPQKGGAMRVVKSVVVARHPPVKEKLASQFTKALSTCAWVRQVLMVVSLGQATASVAGGSTEKVAEQLSAEPQASVATKLMVTEPPQESGALKAERSVVSTSQPPVKANWAIQLSKLVWMEAWVRQGPRATSAGQETVTGVGVGTVKVAVQLAAVPQASVTTKLMVTVPPQESGGVKVARSVVSTSQPPAKAN